MPSNVKPNIFANIVLAKVGKKRDENQRARKDSLPSRKDSLPPRKDSLPSMEAQERKNSIPHQPKEIEKVKAPPVPPRANAPAPAPGASAASGTESTGKKDHWKNLREQVIPLEDTPPGYIPMWRWKFC